MALQGFRQIGASKFSEIMSRAIKVYQTELGKITKEQDGTIQGFSESYKDNPLK